MKRFFAALATTVALGLAAAAPASAHYTCVSTSVTPECQYADRYVCQGSTWWAYRFYQSIYDLNTGQRISHYKETYVERFQGGTLTQSFYRGGWTYSPC